MAGPDFGKEGITAITYGDTGSVETYTVPVTGLYYIATVGAPGGGGVTSALAPAPLVGQS